MPEGADGGKDDGPDSTSKKPEEWHRYFGGNCDDAFKLGLSLTPGQVRLSSYPRTETRRRLVCKRERGGRRQQISCCE